MASEQNQQSLTTIAMLWPSPKAGHSGPDYARRDTGKPQSNLETAVALWPTATARDHRSIHASQASHDKNSRPLSEFVGQWSTPSAGDGRRGGTITESMSGTSLTQQVNSLWMTPRSHEVGDYQYSRGDKTKPVLTLTGQASFLPVLMAVKTGKPHSNDRRSLNPLFVEWLMGWPPGWTLLAWTDFGCSATALCHWKQRMRSALSQLGLPAEAPPAQLGLFG